MVGIKGITGIYKRTKKHKLMRKKLMNTPKIKNKIRKKIIELWKNPIYREKQIQAHLGYKMPENQKKKIGLKSKQSGTINLLHKSGKEASNYIHGKSNKPYPLKFNNLLKKSIRKRDNYQCQKCGIIEEEHIIVYGLILNIHHIDYDKQNCKEDNLITLCRRCNVKVNKDRDYWYAYFTYKNSMGGLK